MIGVLGLQGGFLAHQNCLNRLGIANKLVKLPRDLENLKGLILPGGESTTMLKLMEAYDFFEPLRDFGNRGIPVLGTCAGAILMCDKINGREQKSFGYIPAAIDRNAYGSQRESFSVEVDIPSWNLDGIPTFFIRAPRFADLGDGVAILGRTDGDITAIGYRHFVAVTHHPELADDTRFHQSWYERFVAS